MDPSFRWGNGMGAMEEGYWQGSALEGVADLPIAAASLVPPKAIPL